MFSECHPKYYVRVHKEEEARSFVRSFFFLLTIFKVLSVEFSTLLQIDTSVRISAMHVVQRDPDIIHSHA